jgi:hypothetical protein
LTKVENCFHHWGTEEWKRIRQDYEHWVKDDVRGPHRLTRIWFIPVSLEKMNDDDAATSELITVFASASTAAAPTAVHYSELSSINSVWVMFSLCGPGRGFAD